MEPTHTSGNYLSSFFSGGIAKFCVNNIDRSIVSFHLGYFKPDLKITSAKSQLLGSSVQSFVLFKAQDTIGLSHQEQPHDLAQYSSTFAGNYLAGSLAGVAMSPFCMPFYYLKSDQHKTGPFPSLKAFVQVTKENPSVLARGLVPRAISTGLEFGIYFTLKAALQESKHTELECELYSSLPAILASVPFHQKYISDLNRNTDTKSLAKTFEKKLFSIPKVSPRTSISFVLFSVSNILELAILDRSKKEIDKVVENRG